MPTNEHRDRGENWTGRGYIRCAVCGRVFRPRYRVPGKPANHKAPEGGWCQGRWRDGVPVEQPDTAATFAPYD